MTATDLDLDHLLDALEARARARARAVELRNQAGELVGPGLQAATGRLVVHPGDVIASVWGNTTYDQTVQAYASTADRDTQWSTPKDGAVAYTADTGTLWVRRAGAWQALPRGVIAQAVSTVNSPNQTTVGAASWFTAPAVTLDGTRRVKATFYTAVLQGGAVGDLGGIRLYDGATNLQTAMVRITALGGPGQISAMGVWQGVPAAGTHTYGVFIYLQAGTSMLGAGSAILPAQLIVEDIGT